VTLTGSYGTVTIQQDGSYTYDLDTDNTDFLALGDGETLTDTFAYRIADQEGLSDDAVLTITITGQNDPPTATDNTNTADAGTPTASGNLRTNSEGGAADSDPDADIADLQVTVADTGGTITDGSNVPGGGVTLTGRYGTVTIQQDGSYTYTLDTTNTDFVALRVGETLTDVFSYRIADQEGLSDDAALTITGRNDPPTATDNSASMGHDDPTVSGNVRNDETPDSDPEDPTPDLIVGAVEGGDGNVGIPVAGTYGSVTINGDGSYTYALDTDLPAVSRMGVGDTLTETFAYTIRDTDGGTDTATLTITINGPAVLPAAPSSPATGGGGGTPPADGGGVAPAGGGAPESPSAFDAPALTEGRTQAVPFLGLTDIDGFRDPLRPPIEIAVQLQDRVLAEGTQSFAIPASAFRHTDPAEQISVTATLADGSALPGYLNFDAEAGVFTMNTDVPREAGVEGLTVRVTGRDTDGNEASTTFYITLTEADRSQAIAPGSPAPGEESPSPIEGDVPEIGEGASPPAEAPEDADGPGETEGLPTDGIDDQGAVEGLDQELRPAEGRAATQEQIDGAGRQASLTARDQLLADLMRIFGKAA
jgi:VCBS repeat-containing protein